MMPTSRPINLGSARPPKCLTQGCYRMVTRRGLCLVCYSRAKKMVETGQTTWDEIVDLGLALPSEERGDLFAKGFAKAKRGKDAQTDQRDN